MSKKQEQQEEIETLRDQVDFLARKLREEQLQERRVRRAFYAGARRYLRQATDLVAATGLVAAQRLALEQQRGQLQEQRGWGNATELAEEEVARLLRALHAGAKRYAREQQRANERIALVEESATQSALTMLEAVQDAHESRKLAAAATRRADKLAAKLVIRARQAGNERRAWAGQAQGRERALEAAGKRARGLQAALREAKLWGAGMEAEMNRAIGDRIQALETIRELRQKLRESNKSVLMGSLGGGLEVQPLSGRPFENTAGYSPAARRAAEGYQ